MGKVKNSNAVRLRQYVSEFKDVFTTDDKILFCKACGENIVSNQRSQVTQHVNGHKHIAAVNRLRNQPTRQILLS